MGTPLGDFIRAKRDATRPSDVGLADDGRRRAPGLRRTELSARAGISVEYLTRIEQGRDRNPTLPVLTAIADGLDLDVQERHHLTYVAKITGGACASQRRLAPARLRHAASPVALETLRLLEPDGVAIVTNKLGDVLASTTAFEWLMQPTGLLDDDEPNLTTYVFTHPFARDALLNWDQIADVQAFDLWHAPTVTDSEWLKSDISPLAGPDFTTRISQKLPPPVRPWEIRGPGGTVTRWNRQVLDIVAEPNQQIMILIAADAQTRTTIGRRQPGNVANHELLSGPRGTRTPDTRGVNAVL